METPALRMLKSGQLVPYNDDPSCIPRCFRLPCNAVIVNSESRLRRIHVGQTKRSCLSQREKIVLIVGETGAGKTTLINTVTNHYYRTQWDSQFRLILIAAEDEGNENVSLKQTDSQTDWITAYTLHHQSDCACDYTLTLIDTPGYNDPRGVQRDNETTAHLKEFFTLSGANGGIDQIDGICFVVKSSTNRLTSAQQYVFHSVLSIFGKDIEKNIILMVTHAGTSKPDAIAAAKKAGIPFEEHFKFDNSVLLHTNVKTGIQEGDTNDEDYSAVDADSLTWGRNMRQMDKFYTKLTSLQPQSLQLTQEVLAQRECLQMILKNHKEDIEDGLIDLISLSQQNKYLERYSSTSNIDTPVVEISIVSRTLQPKPLAGVQRATNCDVCKQTCHYPCTLENQELWRCWAMDYHFYEVILTSLVATSPRTTNCTICRNKCPSSSHSNVNFQYGHVDDIQPLDMDYIRQHHQPIDEELSPSELNERVLQASGKARVRVQKLLTDAHFIILRLEEIALKPHTHEVNNFILEMIYEEEKTSRDGWEYRVDHLRYVLKHDKLIQEIKRYHSSAMQS